MSEQSAADFKNLGNKAFAAKDYSKAIEHYSSAIDLDSSNHVYFSNRSASYAGLENYEAAVEDAKECIRLNPEFVKGYYRLATAQMELKEWNAATSTIQQGLSVDSKNMQLTKLLRNAKQQAKRVEGLPKKKVDAALSTEFQDLQQQYLRTNKEYNLIRNSIGHAQREQKSNEITKNELEKLPLQSNAKMYRGVGKVFVLSNRDEVMEHLEQETKQYGKTESDLQQKLEYLERRLKSQQQNMQELMTGQ